MRPDPPSPWLFPLVYGIHLLDEYFLPPSLAPWSVEQWNLHFTKELWLAINIPSWLLLTGAVWLVARRTWPAWVLVSLAVNIGLHALMHLVASVGALSTRRG